MTASDFRLLPNGRSPTRKERDEKEKEKETESEKEKESQLQHLCWPTCM
jgi:hypothetical protein